MSQCLFSRLTEKRFPSDPVDQHDGENVAGEIGSRRHERLEVDLAAEITAGAVRLQHGVVGLDRSVTHGAARQSRPDKQLRKPHPQPIRPATGNDILILCVLCIFVLEHFGTIKKKFQSETWTTHPLIFDFFNFAKALNRTEQNRTEQNRTEQNRTEQNRTEQNRTEQNRTEQNRTEQNRTEQNRTDQNRTEQNRTEQNRIAQNRTEQNRTEQNRKEYIL